MRVQQSGGLAFGLTMAVLFAFGGYSEARAEGSGYTYRSGLLLADARSALKYRDRKKRIVRYKGPRLGVSQLGRSEPLFRSRHVRRRGGGSAVIRQALVSRSNRPASVRQLDAYKGWVNYPKNAGLPEEKEQICALPYGSYTFESLFIPSIPWAPPIAVITSRTRQIPKIDPRLFITKSIDKDKELFGRELENTPLDQEIGEDVLYHY